jgi:hypothetical protein
MHMYMIFACLLTLRIVAETLRWLSSNREEPPERKNKYIYGIVWYCVVLYSVVLDWVGLDSIVLHQVI